MKSVNIFIQARMSSTRLPGKILLPIMGRPLLYYLVAQLRKMASNVKVVVLTTTSPHDDSVVSFCNASNLDYYRGSEEDVLGRYYHAAEKYPSDLIIRITGDCPLIDPDLINQMIKIYQEADLPYDLLSNVINRTFPRGQDIEIFSFDALKRAYHNSQDVSEREHVTMHFYKNPSLYRLKSFEGGVDLSQYRWTVDTIEDFRLIKRLLEKVYRENDPFHIKDLLKALTDHPEWNQINAHIEQKPIRTT